MTEYSLCKMPKLQIEKPPPRRQLSFVVLMTLSRSSHFDIVKQQNVGQIFSRIVRNIQYNFHRSLILFFQRDIHFYAAVLQKELQEHFSTTFVCTFFFTHPHG